MDDRGQDVGHQVGDFAPLADAVQRRTDLATLIGHVAANAPELTARAERAGGILLTGKCHPVAAGRFAVRGSDNAVYAVNTLDGTCTCPDIANGAPERNGVRYCKHLLSTMMRRPRPDRGRTCGRLRYTTGHARRCCGVA